jgi:MATE family multidrug resistance protein
MGIITAVNAFGDLAFGLGWFGMPAFGYKALAWSTFTSICVGLCFNLLVLHRMGLLARKCFAPWRWVRRALPYMANVAWPGGLMQIFWQSGYLAVFAVTGSLPLTADGGPVEALGGLTAGFRVESALFLPGFAFNLTASIVVGDLLGQRQFGEAKASAYRILGIGVAFLSTLAVVTWVFVWPLASFVAPDPGIRAETVDYLAYNLAGMPFTLTTMILAGALVGAGATLYNLLIFATSAWLVRVPLAYVLGHHVMQSADGIWLAMLLSIVFQAGLTLYLFQFGNWGRFAMRKAARHDKDRP